MTCTNYSDLQRSKSWFVVPKKKKDANKSYWRLAFPKQEMEIFNSKQNLKTTLKLLKVIVLDFIHFVILILELLKS